MCNHQTDNAIGLQRRMLKTRKNAKWVFPFICNMQLHYLKRFMPLLLWALPLCVWSQKKLPEPGNFSHELMHMKDCPFDSGAAAMVVFHSAETYYDSDNGNMVTRFRKRIKVFNKNGLEEANYQIRVYAKEDFEFLKGIEGESCTLDAEGRQVITPIGKSSIFKEAIDAYWSSVKIAVPNVVEGSVFEIRYTSVMKHFGGLDYWDFQEELPTAYSDYLLEIPPGAEFAYSVQKAPALPIEIKPMPQEGKIFFSMKNVAGLSFEPYMDAPKNYLQRVIFQLSSYQGSTGGKMKVNNTWEELVRDLSGNDNFGRQLGKKISLPALDAEVAALPTTEAKVRHVYNFVRQKVQWNRYYSKYTTRSLKETLEKGVGNTAEINLLLLNLLQHYEIQCYPLLVADRDYGKVDVNYPFLDKFSKVVAYAIIDSTMQPWIMDASLQQMPAHLTPYQLLNTIALVVDKKSPRLIKIVRPADQFRKRVVIQSAIDAHKKEITSEVKIERFGYAKFFNSQRVNGHSVNPIADVEEEKTTLMEVVSSNRVPAKSENDPDVLELKLRDDLPEGLATLYLNSSMFLGLGANPFKSAKRFSDVNFGYPITLFQVEKITVPPGTRLKEPFEEKMLSYENYGIVFNRQAILQGNELTITTSFLQTITQVAAADYFIIRNFYAGMQTLLELPVVLDFSAAGAQ